MNQILISEKIYVTPKLKRKRVFYKIIFIISILVATMLTSYYAYSEYGIKKSESESQNILSDFNSLMIEEEEQNDDIIVVALNDSLEQKEEVEIHEEVQVNENESVKKNKEPQVLDQFNTVYKAPSGKEYKIDSILNIPSLGINYPVIGECTTELLKISLNKFWGGEPNSVGNYCIVGHNYDGKDILFGKLSRIQNEDIVELKDKTGQTLKYKVYNKFIVQPTDVACTSQITNGKKEMTLITCSDGGKTRLIVKCREID